MKWENRSPLPTAHYVDKANQFREGMNLLADDLGTYAAGVGLLAVHSAIALNDAILTGSTGKPQQRRRSPYRSKKFRTNLCDHEN